MFVQRVVLDILLAGFPLHQSQLTRADLVHVLTSAVKVILSSIPSMLILTRHVSLSGLPSTRHVVEPPHLRLVNGKRLERSSTANPGCQDERTSHARPPGTDRRKNSGFDVTALLVFVHWCLQESVVQLVSYFQTHSRSALVAAVKRCIAAPTISLSPTG